MMKKVILALIAVVTMGITACAENGENNVEKLFKDFASEEAAVYVKVPRFMVWVGTAFACNDEPESRIAKKIKGVKVLTLSDCKEEVKERFCDRVEGLRNDCREEMIRVNDSGDKVSIYGKVDGDDISDLLVFCRENVGDCVLVELKGKFCRGDMAEIMDNQVKKYSGGK